MDVAHDAHVAAIEAMGVFAEHTEHGFIDRIGGATAVVTGLTHPAFNHVSVTGEAADGELRLATLAVDGAGFPWSVMLRDGSDDAHRPWVERLGLREIQETVPLMAATSPRPVPWPEDLERVDGAWTLSMHRALVADAFELPESFVDPLVTEGLAADPTVEIVVGVLDGLPVATALSVRLYDAVAIFNVATSSSVRGRGYGSSVTWAVMERAFDQGAAMASLQTSALGLGVYERLGYEVVATHRRWEAPG